MGVFNDSSINVTGMVVLAPLLYHSRSSEERNRIQKKHEHNIFIIIDLVDGPSHRRYLEQFWLETDIAVDETDSFKAGQLQQTEFKKSLSI